MDVNAHDTGQIKVKMLHFFGLGWIDAQNNQLSKAKPISRHGSCFLHQNAENDIIFSLL